MFLLTLHLPFEVCEDRFALLIDTECQAVDIVAGGFQGQDVESKTTQHCLTLVESATKD